MLMFYFLFFSSSHLVDPAHVEIARGLKLSGEEYEAVSIDVQTDESWLFGQIEFKQGAIVVYKFA